MPQPLEREIPLNIHDERIDETFAEVIERLRIRLSTVQDRITASRMELNKPPCPPS